MLYLLGIALLAAFDQITKLLVERNLKQLDPTPVLGKFLMLYYIENRGAAFGILEGYRPLIIGLCAVLSVVCIGLILLRVLHSVLGDISLMLVAAGGLGNLIDRAFRGYVIDFIDFDALHFAIFNFADSCVTIGVLLLVIYVIRREGESGRRKSKGAIFNKRRF
jgi:signal peptidase II